MEMRWRVSRGFLTHTVTATNVFALPCCHNRDTWKYHTSRLEACRCFFLMQTLFANETAWRSEWTKQRANDCLYSGNVKQFWLIIRTMSANDAIVGVQAKVGDGGSGSVGVGGGNKAAEPIIFYSLHKWHFNKRKFSLLLHYTVLDLCLADW